MFKRSVFLFKANIMDININSGPISMPSPTRVYSFSGLLIG